MGYETGYEGNANPNYPVTIAISTQLSTVINCGGFSLCGVLLPTAFTGTVLTFQASVDGSNFYDVHSTTSGTLLSYTVAPSTFCSIDPKDFHGVQFLKIKSGSSEAAARTLVASLKGF